MFSEKDTILIIIMKLAKIKSLRRHATLKPAIIVIRNTINPKFPV